MCTSKFQLQELQQLLEAYLELGADVGPGSRLPDILLHGIAYRWAQGQPSGPTATDPRGLHAAVAALLAAGCDPNTTSDAGRWRGLATTKMKEASVKTIKKR